MMDQQQHLQNELPLPWWAIFIPIAFIALLHPLCYVWQHRCGSKRKPKQPHTLRPVTVRASLRNQIYHPRLQRWIWSSERDAVLFTESDLDCVRLPVLEKEANFEVNIQVQNHGCAMVIFPTTLHTLLLRYCGVFYSVVHRWRTTLSATERSQHALQTMIHDEISCREHPLDVLQCDHDLEALEIVFLYLFQGRLPDLRDPHKRAAIAREARFMGVPALLALCDTTGQVRPVLYRNLQLYAQEERFLHEQFGLPLTHHCTRDMTLADTSPVISGPLSRALVMQTMSSDDDNDDQVQSMIKAYEMHYVLLSAVESYTTYPTTSSTTTTTPSSSSSSCKEMMMIHTPPNTALANSFAPDRVWFAAPNLQPTTTTALAAIPKKQEEKTVSRRDWGDIQLKVMSALRPLFSDKEMAFLCVNQTAGPIDVLVTGDTRQLRESLERLLLPNEPPHVLEIWKYVTMDANYSDYVLTHTRLGVTIRLLLIPAPESLDASNAAAYVLSHVHLDCDACIIPLVFYEISTKDSLAKVSSSSKDMMAYWLPRAEWSWKTRIVPFRTSKNRQTYHPTTYLAALDAGYRVALTPTSAAPSSNTQMMPAVHAWHLWLSHHFYADRLVSARSVGNGADLMTLYREWINYRRQATTATPTGSGDAMREALCLPFPFRGRVYL